MLCYSLHWRGHLIRCGKKLKIIGKFSGKLCGKMCWLCGKILDYAEIWATSKTTLIPWAAFQCTGCTVNTMSTSILPRILALYSQNKHHFCQVLHVWSFYAIRWQVFLHSTQFFDLNLRQEHKLTCICSKLCSVVSLVTRHLMTMN